jgi:hypothetical protein
MAGNGDTFLVAWKDSTGAAAYGVDILDTANKYSGAYFISRTIMPDRNVLENVGHVSVGYASLPASTAIAISKYVNGGNVESVASATNSKTNTEDATVDVGNVTTLKIKVSMTASSNNAPTIENVCIYL